MQRTFKLMAAFALLTLAATGCKGKAKVDAIGILQPILTAWQQGDHATAIKQFIEADWTKRPLISSDSPLALTEKQFAALATAEQEAKVKQFMPQLSDLRELGKAVLKAGNDAADKKDMATARKHIIAVQQYGDALNHVDHPDIVKLIGQAEKKMADRALAGLGP